jgi:hypothetical protein
MRLLSSMFTRAGLLCIAAAVAQGSPVSRYRVTELPVPAAAQEGCVPGYAAHASIARINDFGVVNATFHCYSVVDPVAPTLLTSSTNFFVAPWFGAVVLPQDHEGAAFTYTINNRGELFGYEPGPAETGGLFAARWTVSGGHERIFFDPACNSIQFQGAVDGNGRYIVGWGLRGDPSLPPPVDELCIKQRWLIRAADGTETSGPLGGTPLALNAHDVAVGEADRSAVSYHVPTGQLRVLHAATSAHSALATGINDLGEISGRILQNAQADISNSCDRSVAVRWDRTGRESVLPHLPGAVSSRAYDVGHDGVTVGDSGAGDYCPFRDNSGERATLWKGGRAHDLNRLIPPSSGITLTYAYGVNRRGQITAGGYVTGDPLTSCPSLEFDPQNGSAVLITAPCRHQRMFLLTPIGR